MLFQSINIYIQDDNDNLILSYVVGRYILYYFKLQFFMVMNESWGMRENNIFLKCIATL